VQPQDIKILLVEDNPGDARLVQILLDEVDAPRFEITHVESLGEALGRLDTGIYDVILADLSLPDSSGLATIERLRDRSFETAIVVLSGREDEKMALQALESGAEDYLVKGRGDGETIARSIRYSLQRKRAEQQLDYLKNYDSLTGLANRTLFRDLLSQTIARADREESNMLAVLFLSLDRFKAINAEFGHGCGDALLKAVAGRIKNALREGNTAARVGGDEFCLIVEDVEEVHEVVSLVGRILDLFKQPFVVDRREISVSASIGISARPPSAGNRLLPEAEFASSRAKEQGHNTYQFYTDEMNVQAFERLSLERSLRRALEREEFSLHYQPQVDLESGRIVGMEALLRWQHPEMGLVPPVRFIPILEETGLIFEVGAWVIHTACEQVKRWEEAGLGTLRIAANISARQFEQNGLSETISRCISEFGLQPGCLELELTESMIMEDPEKSRIMLKRLKSERAVRISVDDFGTGYSSLSYLKLFPLDGLKVDKSFVQDVPEDENDAAIVSTIVALSHALNLEVVAEGVETREQLDFLRERGCDRVQGYYFSPPVTADEFVQLLKSEDPLPGFEN
jgi:diguanylate cyclase (GGDEF)-like protein